MCCSLEQELSPHRVIPENGLVLLYEVADPDVVSDRYEFGMDLWSCYSIGNVGEM